MAIVTAHDSPESASFAPYLAGLRARARRTAQTREVERGLTLDLARRAADLLRERFGASMVFAFGSLVRPGGFDERSDVDLAVGGVTPDQFFRAWAAVSSVVDRPLDLVDLDDCPERLRQQIVTQGVPL